MRAVVQRVSEASVAVEGSVVAGIGRGVVVLLGVARSDGLGDARALATKTAKLRIFPNEHGRFDRSVVDVAGDALVVSQFTLLADTRKGNRPSFTEAAAPTDAEALYEAYCSSLAAEGVRVSRGVFGAQMAISLVNDGPVTIVLDL